MRSGDNVENKVKKVRKRKIGRKFDEKKSISVSKTVDGKKNMKQKDSVKKKKNIKRLFTKTNIIYGSLFLIDIILVIFMARSNIVNYVEIAGHNVFVSETKYLLLGRNYINIIITIFFYIYTILIRKLILHQKLTIKYLILLLFVLVALNLLLFFIFTKRIY